MASRVLLVSRVLVSLGRVVGVFGAAVVVALLIGESLVRGFSPQPVSWLNVYAEGERLPFELAPGARQAVDTGETRWKIFVGEQGFRVASADGPAEPIHSYLLGIGDSFAFGHGVDYEQTFFHLGETGGGEIAIRNLAVPGYGPREYRMLLEQYIDSPAVRGVIVATFLGNDFHDTIWEKRLPVDEGVLGGDGGIKSWAKTSSHLYRLFAGVAHGIGATGGSRDLGPGLDVIRRSAWNEDLLSRAKAAYRAEFLRMRDIVRDHSIPLLVVILPPRAAVDDAVLAQAIELGELAPGDWDRDAATAEARGILRDLAINYIDTTAALRRVDEPLYFEFDGHFRPAANLAVAELLRPELAALAMRPQATELARR